MVVLDCEAELFRNESRGLEGGAFFVATILNRKEAKQGRGKDCHDSMKDFVLLKGDARFCHYFLSKFNLDPDVDVTPDLIKTGTSKQKQAFIHSKVEETLRDLLPFFRKCSLEDPLLDDHPLQEGRRSKYQTVREVTRKTSMEPPALINEDIVSITMHQVQNSLPGEDPVEQNVEKISVHLSGTRSTTVFSCKICSFSSKFKAVCLAHVGNCLGPQKSSSVMALSSPGQGLDSSDDPNTSYRSNPDLTGPEEKKDESKEDFFFNYKNAEFFMDAIFGVTTNYEHYGDGLGCYIVNKLLLPIFHGLRHSNYSTSIHRSVTRILCEATPKEALKLIHERFSNRLGKPGKNINRDRRMEYRIGTAKKLISNLGPNFSQDAVQQVNRTLDIKEELFLRTRVEHGVDIRSGRHNARSDSKDYDMVFSHLTDTRADTKVEGRAFGDFKYTENLMDDKRFNKVEFYRWLVGKNKEAKTALNAKRRDSQGRKTTDQE